MEAQTDLLVCNLVASGMTVAEARKHLGIKTAKQSKAASNTPAPLTLVPGDGGSPPDGDLSGQAEAGNAPAHDPELKPAWMP